MSVAENIPSPPKTTARTLAPGVLVIDNLLPELTRARVLAFLRHGAWQFGWKSKGGQDVYSFWHLHFAGHRKSKQEDTYACAHELEHIPLLRWFWQGLQTFEFYHGQQLVRCYANGMSYGTDGTLHTDSKSEKSYTAIYYPHDSWSPNWGGETVIFNHDMSDIVAAIYPVPNRLAIFKGKLPHVARGVSRTCPELRITLMFKSDIVPSEVASHESPEGRHEPKQSG